MRNLATIQTVRDLTPIRNGISIELATIADWQCVVRKGDFRVGDKGLYFEHGTVPPDREEFAFMWASKAQLGEDQIPPPQPDDFRIGTRKYSNVLSQGCLVPLKQIPYLEVAMASRPIALRNPPVGHAVVDGQDLTHQLGVTKYCRERFQYKTAVELLAPFPQQSLPIPWEPHAQSFPGALKEMHGRPFLITDKLDGVSASYALIPTEGAKPDAQGHFADEDLEFLICSDEFSILIPNREFLDPYTEIAEKYGFERIMRSKYAEGGALVGIQGEICGPDIRRNRLNLTEREFFMHSLCDIQNCRYLDTEGLDWSEEIFGCHAMPVLDYGKSFNYSLKELLKMAQGNYEGTESKREGVVVRPFREAFSPSINGRLSFQVQSNTFLLKNE